MNQEILRLTHDDIDLFWEGKEIKKSRDSIWEEVKEAGSGSELIVLDNVLHVAGGGLVEIFGDSGQAIWNKIVESADDTGEVEIAGYRFGLDELALIGQFYSYARDLGYNFHCVDERLNEKDHPECSIHEQCGACAAVQALILNKLQEDIPVGDRLAEVKHWGLKQGLVADMHDHDTSTIMITYGDHARAINPDRIEGFKNARALPMNVTIPLGLLRQFVESQTQYYSQDAQYEFSTKVHDLLLRWNVGITRAVIEGGHNKQKELAGKELVVANFSGLPDDATKSIATDYFEKAKEKLKKGVKPLTIGLRNRVLG